MERSQVLNRLSLKLKLTGLRNSRGVICAAVFASPDGFPSDGSCAARSGCFAISELPLMLAFDDLPFGRYAATVHHDENMDGELNCNALGIPKEGVGISGNPRIWKGVPPFHKAVFEFSPENTVISIAMKYFL